MAINQHNYEAYFIDYHEGNLSTAEKAALMAFLEAHPDLKCELDEFEVLSLQPDDAISYNNKEAVKVKALSNVPTEMDEMLIAYLEGELAENEKAELESSLEEDKQMTAGLIIFEKSKLKPELKISYPDKSSLKKKVGILALPTWTGYTAAAMIILLLGLTFYFRFSTSAPQIQKQASLARLTSISLVQIDYSNNKQMYQREVLNIKEIQTNYREPYTAVHLTPKKITHIKYPKVNSAELAIVNPRIISAIPSYQSTIDQELLASDDKAEQKEKSLIGKMFSSIFGKVAPNSGSRKKSDASAEPRSFWDIANLGMRGVNALGDHDYTLVKQYNEKGNVKGVSILEE